MLSQTDMPSQEFESLRSNISLLKQSFLKFDKRPDGDYTQDDRMNCRAFIAFSHAEFEHYLESISLRILNAAIEQWQKKSELGRVAVAILAFRRRENTSIPDNPKDAGKKNTLASILMEAFATQKGVISGNHGIKPKNFSEIYTPLGITENDIEETLLIQLSNTGSHRGDLVHKSATISLPLIRDPFSDEEKEVDLLVELERFDARLDDLKLIPALTI